MIRFKVEENQVTMRVGEKPIGFSVKPALKFYVNGQPYEGEYVVEPSFSPQTLPTKEKVLAEDVTVNAIRVERVSNAHGTTVYIGTKGD